MFRILQFCLIVTGMVCGISGHAFASDDEYVAQCTPAWNQFSGTDQISSTIHSSIKGNDGFVYLGGRDGLYQVTGGDVRSWLPDFTNPNALPSGHLKALTNYNEHIWIGTNTGIVRFNTKTGLFERNESVNRNMAYAPVQSLVIHKNHLFVATKQGVYSVLLDDAVENIELLDSFTDIGAVSTLLVYDEQVLAMGERGVWNLTANQAPYKHDLDATQIQGATVLDNALWLVSLNHLYRKNSPESPWNTFSRDTLEGLPDSEFTNVSSDSFGRLWIGSRRRIARWDFNEAHPSLCHQSILGSNADQDINIAHLSGDLGPFMFLGSRGRGASFAPMTNAARRVIPGGHYDSGLPPISIWSHTLTSAGGLIAGTSKGVFREQINNPGYFDPITPEVLGKLLVYTLVEMSESTLWIGTNKGLYINHGDQTTHVDLLSNALEETVRPAVYSIKINKNKIYLATNHGLIVLDKTNHQPIALFGTKADLSTVNLAPSTELSISRIWSVDFYNDKTFAAGNEGVYELDIENVSVISSTVTSEQITTQPIGYIYNVSVVDSDRLFLGTESGVVETNFTFSEFKKITEINGRKLLAVMSSGRDHQGNIWLGVAKNGLFRYNLEEDTWSHLTQSKGLITNGVSQLGLSFTEFGTMTVSNASGASIVDLNQVQWQESEALTFHAIEEKSSHLFENGEVYTIGPEERDIRISFSATSLIERGLHSVYYSLTPENESPRTAKLPFDEALSFINLSPGLYTFSALVSDTSNSQSAPLSFQFEIKPFWWETDIAKVFVFLVLLSAVIVFFVLRTRSIKRRLVLINDERKRVAQELHDTSLQDVFGAKMLGRALFADIVDQEEKAKADRFVSLIDKAIASLRNSVDSLSASAEVPQISEALADLESTITLPEGTRLFINTSGKPWRIAHQRRFFLYRIIREAAINAAKHAGADKIIIALNWTRLRLDVSVRDNGCGFDVEEKEHSRTFGLRACDSMAKNGNLSLSIASSPDNGTTVTISVQRFFS